MAVKHIFECLVPDGADATIVRPSDWNEIHEAEGGSDGNTLQRDSTAVDGSGMKWTNTPIAQAIRFLLTVPGSPVNGDIWFTATGTSPTRVITLWFRDGSTTVQLLSMTY